MAGVADEIVDKLDKQHFAMHRLYRDATKFVGGEHLKDLSKMNRDINRIVLIDDEPISAQLQPRNVINIKPFKNGSDRMDRELLDLIPFLQAVAAENVRDIPALLDEFRNSNGEIDDLPSKYAARVHMVKEQQRERETKGLGGLLRGRRMAPAAPGSAAPSQLTSKP